MHEKSEEKKTKIKTEEVKNNDERNTRVNSKRKIEETTDKEIHEETYKRKKSKERKETEVKQEEEETTVKTQDHKSTPRRSARFRSSLLFFSNADKASIDDRASSCNTKLINQKKDFTSKRQIGNDDATILGRRKSLLTPAKIEPTQSQPNPNQICKIAKKPPAQKSNNKAKLSLSNQPLITSFTRSNPPLRPPLQDQLPPIKDSPSDKPNYNTNSLSCSQEPPQRSCRLIHSKSDS